MFSFKKNKIERSIKDLEDDNASLRTKIADLEGKTELIKRMFDQKILKSIDEALDRAALVKSIDQRLALLTKNFDGKLCDIYEKIRHTSDKKPDCGKNTGKEYFHGFSPEEIIEKVMERLGLEIQPVPATPRTFKLVDVSEKPNQKTARR